MDNTTYSTLLPAKATTNNRERDASLFGIPLARCSIVVSYVVIAPNQADSPKIAIGKKLLEPGLVFLHRRP